MIHKFGTIYFTVRVEQFRKALMKSMMLTGLVNPLQVMVGAAARYSSIQLDTAQVSFLKYWLKLKSQRDRGVLEKKYD